MSINIEKIKKLNDMVSVYFRRKHTIVLNPDEKDEQIENSDDEVVYDKIGWKITDEFNMYINQLSQNNELSTEDKIMQIYEKICKDYIYDDNLISYIKEVDEDIYSVPDWYGRDVDNEWEENRKKHNRRVCYELCRYLAKALKDLLKNEKDYDICIHWNKNLTHYIVGLTSDDYSITLDPDNFFNIKDLTRIKTELTAQGITILEDKTNKFSTALAKFNEGKDEFAINKIENQISTDKKVLDSNPEMQHDAQEEIDDIVFIQKALKILTEKYHLDSQGAFEFIKEIVDIRLGSVKRQKIWKKIEGETKESTRYIRCLLITIKNQKYLLDVDKCEFRLFDDQEFDEKRTSYIPYKELSRGGFDYYDGT